jgi:hypothetical protein
VSAPRCTDRRRVAGALIPLYDLEARALPGGGSATALTAERPGEARRPRELSDVLAQLRTLRRFAHVSSNSTADQLRRALTVTNCLLVAVDTGPTAPSWQLAELAKRTGHLRSGPRSEVAGTVVQRLEGTWREIGHRSPK